MEEEELTEETTCCDCGAVVATGTDRTYALDDDAFLCFACAVRRGGAYDELDDRWTKAPAVGDLPDERRPHP